MKIVKKVPRDNRTRCKNCPQYSNWRVVNNYYNLGSLCSRCIVAMVVSICKQDNAILAAIKAKLEKE